MDYICYDVIVMWLTFTAIHKSSLVYCFMNTVNSDILFFLYCFLPTVVRKYAYLDAATVISSRSLNYLLKWFIQ